MKIRLIPSYANGGNISPDKAREILHDGTIRGHAITDKQRRFFGAMSNKFDNGGSITNLSTNQTSNPIFEFNGPSHEEGGIPINYQGTDVEVEGDETGYIDKGGDLNVFGNMYVPGTKMKFKSVSKEVARVEDKANRRLKNASNLMNTVQDFDNPYERLRANTASIMGKSALTLQQKATDTKEKLAELQNNMLDHAKSMGVDPKELYGKATRGISLPGDPPFANAANNNTLPIFVPNFDKSANVDIPYDRLGYDIDSIKGIRKDNPVSTKLTNRIPTDFVNSSNSNLNKKTYRFDSDQTPVYNDRLGLSQILPELYTLATNKQEYVPVSHFNPQLSSPYRVSFQDRLNQNTSTLRSIGQMSNINPAAASQLAAQKYQADQQILGDQFRANQSIQEQITNRNIDVLNQAQLQNIGFARENEQLRAQNAAMTRATTRAALTSIAGKNLQQQQYNKALTMYNSMIPHYRFDPDTGQWDFNEQAAPANLSVNNMSNSNYNPNNPYGDNKVTNYIRDNKGKIVQREEQKSPGMMKIFRRR